MDGSYSTTLEWSGSLEIGERLSSLVPANFEHELVKEGNSSRLTIKINANSLENLRTIVDDMLTLFSDQDE